jgi:hypothetical protein
MKNKNRLLSLLTVLLLVVLVVVSCSKKEPDPVIIDPVPTAKLLHSEDFETDFGQVTSSHGIVRYARTTSNPKSGNNSLRFNLRENTTDPITGLAGHGLYTANWIPKIAISESMTWVYNLRFDDANWAISDDVVGNQVGLKLFYLMTTDPNNLGKTFYVGGAFGNTTSIAIADNGDPSISGWEKRPYGWRRKNSQTPLILMYLNTGYPSGSDGLWHEFRIQIKYNYLNLGYTKMRMLVDKHPLKENNDGGNTDSDGWFNLPPEMIVAGARLAWTNTQTTNNATDRTGFACGLQWDDFKVYSGIVD